MGGGGTGGGAGVVAGPDQRLFGFVGGGGGEAGGEAAYACVVAAAFAQGGDGLCAGSGSGGPLAGSLKGRVSSRRLLVPMLGLVAVLVPRPVLGLGLVPLMPGF